MRQQLDIHPFVNRMRASSDSTETVESWNAEGRREISVGGASRRTLLQGDAEGLSNLLRQLEKANRLCGPFHWRPINGPANL